MSVRLKDFRTNDQRMKALLDLPPSSFVDNAADRINVEGIVYVNEDHAAVTAPGASYEILGTDSLTTCMAVAVHNTTTRATGLAHLSEEEETTEIFVTGADALRIMLGHVKGTGGEIEARIIGPNVGWPMNREFINKVLDILQDYDVKILSADFAHKKGLSVVATHAGLWHEGLIRGESNASALFHAYQQGDKKAQAKLRAEVVNIECMGMGVNIRPSPEGLAYNGLLDKDIDLQPGPL